MSKPDQGKLDQRGSEMEDSNTMTIKYLRARLLSERSVSQSARQRADALAERVVELEEQLRMVSLQRMKAEKATADVLVILGDHGLSDISETFDSNSEPDTPLESRMSNEPSKEDEVPINSKGRIHESELSGSDFEFTVIPDRSLSWRGRNDSVYSAVRYKDPLHRRWNSLASVSLSQRHRSGRSCRQIRRKESRSGPEEFKGNTIKVDSPSKETSATVKFLSMDGGEETGGEVVEDNGENLLEATDSGCIENGSYANGIASNYDVHGRDGDMEQALEHQAQLISQYEAMETAQREWEVKFRENNSSTPDSCDPGNRSDVTEERYEIKAQASHSPSTVTSQTHGTNAEAEGTSKFNLSGVSPLPGDLEHSKELKSSGGAPISEFLNEKFEVLAAKGKQKRESFKSDKLLHLLSAHHDSHSHGSHDLSSRQLAPTFSSNTGTTSKEEVPRSPNRLYALVPQKGSDELGGILEELKLAKQSLQQKIMDLPVVEGGSLGPPLPSRTLRGTGDTAVGWTGLFRLPTDFAAEGNSQSNIPTSTAQPSFGNYYSDATTALSDRLVASPFLRTRSSMTSEDHFHTTQLQGQPVIPSQKPYLGPSIFRSLPSSSSYIPSEDQYVNYRNENVGPKIRAQNPYFDPSSNKGLTSTGGYIFHEGEIPSRRYTDLGTVFATQGVPSDPYFNTNLLTSTRYTSASYLVNPSYHGSMPRIPTTEGFSTSLPTRLVGIPSAGHLQFSNEQIRPDMYRY